jgi:putative ABC transport system permease protein
MRTLLWPAVRRAAWKMKGRLLAAGLIMGSALGMYIGVYSAIDSLFASRDGWYRQLAVADLELRVVPEDAINIPPLAGVPGVRAVEQRLMLPGHISTPAGGKLYTVLSATPDAPTIHRLRIEAGQNLDPARPDEVVIERSMAQHHGYQVGDRFRLHVGKDHYDLRVRGIATSPEFLIDSANPNFFLPSKGSLGVVYAPYTLIEPRLGYRLVNSLLFHLDAAPGDHAAVAAAEAAVHRALGRKLTVDESLPLARQFGHLYLELDLGAFGIFVPAIVAIFVLTALVITVFLMGQWIGEKRAEIGLAMALGYRRRDIALAFVAPVLWIALVAALSGLAIGVVMLHGFGLDYAKALGLPLPTLALRPGYVAQGLAGMVLLLALATLAPLRHILALTPRAALRGDPGEAAAQGGQRLAQVRGPLVWRYALRNLQRSRRLAWMAVAAVALSLGASLSYFISLTSFEQSIVKRFAADDWQVAVDFVAPLWVDELAPLTAVPGVTRAEPYLRGSIKLQRGDMVEPSLLLGLAPGSPARSLRMVAGRGLQRGDADAIVLERKTATALAVQPGDLVLVDVRDQRRPVTVVGVFSGVLPGESYAALADVQAWFDMAGQATGSFLHTGPGYAGSAALYAYDRVARVTAKDALVQEFVHHLKEIAGIVFLAFAFSLLVAALFLFATTAYGVLRRLPEYATLRTIGFADGTVLKTILLEVALVGVAGVLAAVLVGVALAQMLTGLLSQAWFQVDTSVTLADVLVVLLPALAVFPLTALPPFRSIVRAGLVPNLRRRAFG